jgi:hypothetical protein
MKRALIASTVALTALLAFMAWRLVAPPAPPPVPAASPAVATEPGAPAEARAAEPRRPSEATSADAARREGSSPGEPARAPAQATPRPPSQRSGGPRPAEVAGNAAIFSDRPSADAAVEQAQVRRGPLLPVLRRPNAALVSSPYPPVAVERPRLSAALPAGTIVGARAAPAWRGARPRQSGVASARPPTSRAGAVPATGPAAQALPGALSGTLRDATGAPVSGASVLAVASGGADAFETITDDDGFYLLAAVRPGRYLVFADLDGRVAGRLPARSVEVPDGVVARVELRGPSAGATVRVRALQADGRPAPGQAVLVTGPVVSPASLAGLMSSDSIFLPEPGAPGLLRHVPAGVYTLLILQGEAAPPQVVRRPITVRADAEQQIEVRLPEDVVTEPQVARQKRTG